MWTDLRCECSLQPELGHLGSTHIVGLLSVDLEQHLQTFIHGPLPHVAVHVHLQH